MSKSFVKKKCPKCGKLMERYVEDCESECGAYEVGWKCKCGYSEGQIVY